LESVPLSVMGLPDGQKCFKIG